MLDFSRIAAIAVFLVLSASLAWAQSGAVRGTVKDADGRPIKGATIKASNPNGKPPEFTATTDDKGRFAVIGLTSGVWTFVAEAPGFEGQRGTGMVRSTTTGNRPIVFALERTIGPLPGALPRQIAADISAADGLRDSGRVDQAIAAYEEILARNPTLTMMNLVIAESYRLRAEKEADPTAREPLLDRAIASYQQVLKAEPENALAKSELERTRQAKAN